MDWLSGHFVQLRSVLRTRTMRFNWMHDFKLLVNTTRITGRRNKRDISTGKRNPSRLIKIIFDLSIVFSSFTAMTESYHSCTPSSGNQLHGSFCFRFRVLALHGTLTSNVYPNMTWKQKCWPRSGQTRGAVTKKLNHITFRMGGTSIFGRCMGWMVR